MEMKEIIQRAGGVTKLAAAVGRHHATVLGWSAVPPKHVRLVATLIGATAHELRPDLWDARPSDAATDHSDDTRSAERLASGLAA